MDQPLRPRVLESLYQHRLLTSSQLAEILSPGAHPGWLRRVMAALASSGLVDRIRLRPPASQAVWFLTPAGAQLVENGHSGTWRRRYVVTPDVATGPLQAHMLAENDVGIAFMRAARRHNHECGYLSWRHEVAHKLPGGSGSVIADVLLHYVAVGAGSRGSDVVLWRFFEVDRGHMPRAVLVEKLQDYVALYRGYVDAMGGKSPHPPRWVERYPSFPAVVLVFTNGEHRLLMSRIRSVAEICRRDRVVGETRLPIVFTTLEDLQTRGPFAPIFWPVGDPDRPVDVMGQSVRPNGAESRTRPRRPPLPGQQALVEA